MCHPMLFIAQGRMDLEGDPRRAGAGIPPAKAALAAVALLIGLANAGAPLGSHPRGRLEGGVLTDGGLQAPRPRCNITRTWDNTQFSGVSALKPPGCDTRLFEREIPSVEGGKRQV